MCHPRSSLTPLTRTFTRMVNETRSRNSRRLETSQSKGVDTNVDEGDEGNGGSVGRRKRKRS